MDSWQGSTEGFDVFCWDRTERKNGLPFSFATDMESVDETDDLRYSKNGNFVTARASNVQPNPNRPINGLKVLRAMQGEVNTAMYRVHPLRDGKKFSAAWMDESTGESRKRVRWTIGATPELKGGDPIDATQKGTQDHPALVIDEAGRVWAAWESKDTDGRRTVWIRSSAEGSKSTQVSDDEQGIAAYPSLAAGGGIVGVAFEARKNGDSVVFRRLR